MSRKSTRRVFRGLQITKLVMILTAKRLKVGYEPLSWQPWLTSGPLNACFLATYE